MSSARSSPAMQQGKWKVHDGPKRGDGIEPSDLSADPSESQNIADDHPEVVARLKGKFDAWVSRLPEHYEKNS
jgi:hypothetical protein